MQADEVRRLLEEAMRETEERDRYLFETDAAERSIAAGLVVSLSPRFRSWSVDADYNRMNGRYPKRIEVPPECSKRRNNNGEALALPDVIVHGRPRPPNSRVTRGHLDSFKRQPII